LGASYTYDQANTLLTYISAINRAECEDTKLFTDTEYSNYLRLLFSGLLGVPATGDWKCTTWKFGTTKISGGENAGLENAEQEMQGWKCETSQYGKPTNTHNIKTVIIYLLHYSYHACYDTYTKTIKAKE